jgi:hypothetical protein
MFFLQIVKNSDRECTSAMMGFSVERQTPFDVRTLANQLACYFGTMFAEVVFGLD